MNSNKRNYAWTLCPSKSFPGKFYYFNMLTGEAAWSVNDIEMRSVPKKNCVHRINEKWHTYPEPDSPPIDDACNNTSWHMKKPDYPFSRLYANHSPMFGQPAFQKCTPNTEDKYVPNVYLPQTYTSPETQWKRLDIQHVGESKREMSNSNCPNCNKISNPFLRIHKSIYQSPHENVFNFKSYDPSASIKNKCVNCDHGSVNDNIFLQTNQSNGKLFECQPKSLFVSKRNQQDVVFRNTLNEIPQTSKPVIREPIFKRTRSISEGDALNNRNLFNSLSFDDLKTIDNSILNKPCMTKFNLQRHPSSQFKNNNLSRSLENLTETDTVFDTTNRYKSPIQDCRITPKSVERFEDLNCSFEMSTIPSRKRLHSPENPLDNDVHIKLPRNDLRYMLMARTRKGDPKMKNRGGEVKKLSTSSINNNNQNRTNMTAKKRVTFDLGVGEEMLFEELEETNIQDADNNFQPVYMEQPINMSMLRSLAKSTCNEDHWYVVTDLDILLEDFDFINNFIRTDEKCVLLIPRAVRSQIDALSVRGGGQAVLPARQLSRRLAAADSRVTVQLAEIDNNPDTYVNQSILNCCLEVVDQNYHVVLITKDKELLKEARSIDLHCYSLQDIKDGVVPAVEVSFDIQKIQTPSKVVDMERHNNLFLQVRNDYNPFSLSKDTFPVNCFRKRLFETANSGNINENSIFRQNNDIVKSKRTEDFNKRNENTIKVNDYSKYSNNTTFPPKNLSRHQRDQSDHESDNVITTSDIGHIGIKIQDLNLKEANKTVVQDIQDGGNESQEKCKQTKAQNQIADGMKFKNLNAYTMEAHLKRFNVTTKVVEDRLKLRMEEWICSFSQIMEDTLSDILSNAHASNNPGPLPMPEAVDYLIDTYSEHASLRIIAEKFSAMLFNCSENNGKLKATTKPSEFMKILGCGIILIHCLKNVLSKSVVLVEAENSLNSLLQNVVDPTTDPEPPQVVHTPILRVEDNMELHEQRRNFVKKPSEVIDYLKKHFPEWQSYKEIHNDWSSVPNFNEKSKQNLVVRTFGKNLNTLSFDRTKSMTLTDSIKPNVVNKENGVKITRNINITDEIDNINEQLKKDFINLKDCNEKNLREKGAKLLKKLALNPFVKPKKLKEIDVEKREVDDKKLLSMLDHMVNGIDLNVIKSNDNNFTNTNDNAGPKVIRRYSLRSAGRPENNSDITDTFTIINTNNRKKNNSPKLIRKFDIKQFPNKTNDKPKDMTDPAHLDTDNTLNGNSFSENKNRGPKVIRKFNIKQLPINTDVKPNDVTDSTHLEAATTESNTFNGKSVGDDKNHGPKVIKYNIKKLRINRNDKPKDITNSEHLEIVTNEKSTLNGNSVSDNKKRGPKLIRKGKQFPIKNNDPPNGNTDLVPLETITKENTFNSNSNNDIKNDGPKVIRKFHMGQFPIKTSNKPKYIADLALLDTVTNENTFTENSVDGNKKAGPKVIRNLTLIEAFENKYNKANGKLDLNMLDYSGESEDGSHIDAQSDNNVCYNETANLNSKSRGRGNEYQQDAKDNEKPPQNIDVNDKYAQNDGQCDVDASNDTTVDSGFESESAHAYSLVKAFLTELSCSFKNIYQFINTSVNEFRDEEVQEWRRKLLHEKANKTHTILADIIDKLKSIIKRESTNGATLKAMLVKAGVQAEDDKRMARYKQVITKCLEQAQMLSNALKVMLSVTDEDFGATSMSSITTISSKIEYINIFE